jgi:histidine ammonia-lyase
VEALKLGAKDLTLEEVREVALHGRKVELSSNAIRRIERAHEFLLSQSAKGGTVYGLNTGFGPLSDVRIANEDIETLQQNFLRSHAVGVGSYIPDRYVRAMLLLRANALAIGNSGVNLATIEHLLTFLNRELHPLVPEQGSVGASGDLAPLAHLALCLIGEGRARVKGREMTGAQALRAIGLKPLRLGPKEGLALTNGTQFMTAFGTLNLLEAEYLCDVADAAGAMSVESLRGTLTAFAPEIHRVRAHPGQVTSAQNVRKMLAPGGKKSEIAKSHENCGKVQDPYSIRCIPQVHGASRDALIWVRHVLEREINSVTDNPLVFPSSKQILSGGNFHGQIVSMAMDFLSIAVAELASISEIRIDKLMNPAFSSLPIFLTRQSGLNSGFMIVQYAAASIVSENKTLCHPAVVDSIPTSVEKEDHVSMGAWATRKAAQVIVNTRRVLAMEIAASSQAIDLLRPLRSSEPIEAIHRIVRKKVLRLDADRSLHSDLQAIELMISQGEFEEVIARAFGKA